MNRSRHPSSYRFHVWLHVRESRTRNDTLYLEFDEVRYADDLSRARQLAASSPRSWILDTESGEAVRADDHASLRQAA